MSNIDMIVYTFNLLLKIKDDKKDAHHLIFFLTGKMMILIDYISLLII